MDSEYSFEPPGDAAGAGAGGEAASPHSSAGEGGAAGGGLGIGAGGDGGAVGNGSGSGGEPDNLGGAAGKATSGDDAVDASTGGSGEPALGETGGTAATGGTTSSGGMGVVDGTGGQVALAGAGGDSTTGEAPALRCNPSEPFQEPELFLDTGASDGGARLSPDELTLYFHTTEGGRGEIWSANRDAIDEPFGEAQHLTGLDTEFDVLDPTATGDGLELYYSTGTDQGTNRILVSIRSNRVVAFEAGSPVANVTGDDSSSTPFVLPDGSELFFTSDRDGGADLFHTYRQGGGFGTPSPLSPLNSDSDEAAPVVTEDGLTIYFSRRVSNNYDIYRATRRTRSASFGDPELMQELSSPDSHDFPSWVSADDCVVYLGRPVVPNSTNWNVLMATRPTP